MDPRVFPRLGEWHCSSPEEVIVVNGGIPRAMGNVCVFKACGESIGQGGEGMPKLKI